MKTNALLLPLFAFALLPLYAQQKSTVTETVQTVKTYPFSDSDPVANPSTLFYPYFRFDGFAAEGVDKPWKVVELENEYIKLSLFPEVGGKVWGAIEKSTGKEFIYNNNVVKFRDIAMRGPWTSGGIEFNFGIIGHAPTSSTPVDYLTRSLPDGSVSCYISSIELITRTVWTVEVNLPADKGYFTTRTTWYNSSAIDQPYYQWMNAGYPVGGNAQFCYPGTNQIGHGGELFPFPKDATGRDISWYEKNNFGNSKSYHVLGKYNDYYGAYWHADDFGSIHHAAYDEKLGMKIFLWGLAREGGIWEDLLTDTNGQYIELQSGRMYNQPASNSTFSPYKHASFGPAATDQWTEYWFPAKGTRGVAKASRIGTLNLIREDGFLKLYFSPLQTGPIPFTVSCDGKIIYNKTLMLNTLEVWKDSIPETAATAGGLNIVLGNQALVYSEKDEDNVLSRPKVLPADLDWNTAYGLYTQGEQWMNQKVVDKAEHFLTASLEKDPCFLPALTRLASLTYREGRYDEALSFCKKALSINTYHGESNYLYGLINLQLGKETDAKDGFSVATFDLAMRSGAYAKLAVMSLRAHDWIQAEQYARKSLDYNQLNLESLQIQAVAYRKNNQPEKAQAVIKQVLEMLPLYHPIRFETYALQPSTNTLDDFSALIRNELPDETYLEIAGWYQTAGCTAEALKLLTLAPNNPIAGYQTAYLLAEVGDADGSRNALQKANQLSPAKVFPFRPEHIAVLDWAAQRQPDWKITYYQGLLYWANQNKAKALELLNSCTDVPYAPFYLSRALLKQREARLQDLQQAEQTERSWRTGFALINYYTAAENWNEACRIGKQYGKLYPANYYIGLKYAKALCETKQYQACLALLKKLQVLPNEGAYAGRAVYREANLYQAMDYIAAGKSSAALKFIADSKQWIENLGVGKPYDDQLDNRFEDYLEAEACAERPQAEALLQQVAAYPQTTDHFNSNNLLTALALRKLGEKAEADQLVKTWSVATPDNQIVQWCTAVYHGETQTAATLLNSRKQDKDATPWETTRKDLNLDLLIRYVNGK